MTKTATLFSYGLQDQYDIEICNNNKKKALFFQPLLVRI